MLKISNKRCLYLDHIAPVIIRLAVWLREIVSTGRLRSPIPAITKPHLNVGAQKNTVVGPKKTLIFSKHFSMNLVIFFLREILIGQDHTCRM